MEVLPLGGPHPSGGSGGTLSNGIQDDLSSSAALLPLLRGTEQCEDHIATALTDNISTRQPPRCRSIFGSLCRGVSNLLYRLRLRLCRRGVQGTDPLLVVFYKERVVLLLREAMIESFHVR